MASDIKFTGMSTDSPKPPRGWVGKSIIGIFYLVVASMFTIGLAAVYAVGLIATGHFGVDEFQAFAGQIHHYRNQALLVATGGASLPILRHGGAAFGRYLLSTLATAVADKITK